LSFPTDASLSERPALQLRAAECTFGVGETVVHALRATDLTIWPADSMAIMGTSGSGKSTLLNVLGLLVRPTAGEVLVSGLDVAGLDDAQLSALRGAHLGFVFQAFHLLPHRTVYENVELPLRYAKTSPALRHEMVLSRLDQVGLLRRASHLPPKLSGGERQRCAIARALVRQPQVVLCDEPTGNLDSRSAANVLDVLDNLNSSGTTVVVVTHDESVAARSARLIRLADGRATEARA